MPPRASKSGHCKMRVQVGESGKPTKVEAVSCSDDIFRAYSVDAVRRWEYLKSDQTGQLSWIDEPIVKFSLVDERGNIIPE